ncbi:MAG: SH3 domain-containing protein [Dokdonella sp.]
MKTSTTLFGLLAAAGLALVIPVSAQAGHGYLSVNVNLRAGPAIDYPSVYVAPRGSAVEVYGCIDSWEWCDVSWDGYRGWVSGNYLDYGWNGRRVPVYDYGPRLGLSLISFNFGTYWNSHYRHRSWYGQRHRYERIAPRHHGYYAPRHHARGDNRYDRRDYRRDIRNDHREARRDVRNERRDVHNTIRHDRRNVRQDRREVRREVRNDRREVRRDVRRSRQDNRQLRQQVLREQRQVSQQSRNVRQDARQQRQQHRAVAREDSGRSNGRHRGGDRKER